MTMPVPPAKLASQDPPIRSWPGHSRARTSHPHTRLQEGQYESSVPNTADRVAQTAAAMVLEDRLERVFHRDSYGYRPGRSAHDALAACRRRCWKQDWVLDIDVRAFFDSVPHSLLLKAVVHHTSERWVLLYISRWLAAPMQMPDGTIIAREKGTPQGSPISPILANLFMHYAFDMFLAREFPAVQFERYCDDAVVHCETEQQARTVWVSALMKFPSLRLVSLT